MRMHKELSLPTLERARVLQTDERGLTALDWPSLSEIDASDAYDRWAEFYDSIYGDLDGDARFYLAAAEALVSSNDRLLEIGIGTGRLTAHLLERGHRIVGIDTSAQMLALATIRFARTERLELVLGDVREVTPGGPAFALAIAPYGMTAHLLTDADRLVAFRNVHAQLKPDGVFIFDDCPNWMHSSGDGTTLTISPLREDPQGTGRIRLMSNTVDTSGGEVSLRYDFIDRLDEAGRVLQRSMVRIVFRNIDLATELRLLGEAGFGRVDVLGGFDGRPLDAENPAANSRLILRAHRHP
jgi:SAM-dependent methyltransferase